MAVSRTHCADLRGEHIISCMAKNDFQFYTILYIGNRRWNVVFSQLLGESPLWLDTVLVVLAIKLQFAGRNEKGKFIAGCILKYEMYLILHTS